jgi:hypothetical protein
MGQNLTIPGLGDFTRIENQADELYREVLVAAKAGYFEVRFRKQPAIPGEKDVSRFRITVDQKGPEKAPEQVFKLPNGISFKDCFNKITREIIHSLNLADKFSFLAEISTEDVSWQCGKSTTYVLAFTVFDFHSRWSLAKYLAEINNLANEIKIMIGVLRPATTDFRIKFSKLSSDGPGEKATKRAKEEKRKDPNLKVKVHDEKMSETTQYNIYSITLRGIGKGEMNSMTTQLPATANDFPIWLSILEEKIQDKLTQAGISHKLENGENERGFSASTIIHTF